MPRKPRQVRFRPFIAECPDCGDLVLLAKPGAFGICGGCDPKSATAFDAGDGYYWRQVGKSQLANLYSLRSKRPNPGGIFVFRAIHRSKYGRRRPKPLPI